MFHRSLPLSLCEKGPYLEFFWSEFGKIRTMETRNTDTFYLVSISNFCSSINPLSANFTKWSETLKNIRRQFANKLFECVRPFCAIGAERVKCLIKSCNNFSHDFYDKIFFTVVLFRGRHQ